jgi:V/A-type H+-transporting ATPase subunit E
VPGYPELLRVIEAEAEREVREAREAAERERARILDEAREGAAALQAALLTRTRRECDDRERLVREGLSRARERARLLAMRAELDALRAAAAAELTGRAGPALDARLMAELLPEAGDGPLELEVDPGAEAPCRAALERLDPAAAARTRIHAAPARRGGVVLIAGRRILDDTLPARLERLWPELEAELAGILFGEEGAWPGSTG